jgi:hypothetical protein
MGGDGATDREAHPSIAITVELHNRMVVGFTVAWELPQACKVNELLRKNSKRPDEW